MLDRKPTELVLWILEGHDPPKKILLNQKFCVGVDFKRIVWIA